MDKNISFTLKVWRQAGPKAKGAFETYQMKDIPGDCLLYTSPSPRDRG